MAYQKITETDRYLFGKGTHYEIYEKLGAHPAVSGKRHGVSFAVWAPHAASVSVIGDFNGWDPNEAPMEPLADSGIWETFVPGAKKGDLYKFYITDETGKGFAKADPYAFYSELRPGTASRIFDLSGFSWQDQEWMAKRPRKKPVTEPYAIYEVHPGSWKKHDGEGDSAF